MFLVWATDSFLFVWLDARPFIKRTGSYLEGLPPLIFGVIQIASFVAIIVATTTTLRTGKHASYLDAVQFSTLYIVSGLNVRHYSKRSAVADYVDSLDE
jgi:hypothetical protein